MRYSRFQLGFTRNKKIRRLSDAAFRLWATAIDHAREQCTDGVIEQDDLEALQGIRQRGQELEVVLTELLEARCLERRPKGGWKVHDFLVWQDSAQTVEEKQRRARERMREVRANTKDGSREVRDGPSDPLPDPDQANSQAQISDLPGKSGSAREARPKKRRGNMLGPMPEQFQVSQKHLDYAKKKAWPEWWLRNRHEHFCELAQAKAWRYADWDLALYTFLRNEIGYRRGPSDMAQTGVPIPFARTQAPRQPDTGVRPSLAATEGT